MLMFRFQVLSNELLPDLLILPFVSVEQCAHFCPLELFFNAMISFYFFCKGVKLMKHAQHKGKKSTKIHHKLQGRRCRWVTEKWVWDVWHLTKWPTELLYFSDSLNPLKAPGDVMFLMFLSEATLLFVSSPSSQSRRWST